MKKRILKLKVIIHEAEEGGLWAEIPPCQDALYKKTIEELIPNINEALEGCLSAKVEL